MSELTSAADGAAATAVSIEQLETTLLAMGFAAELVTGAVGSNPSSLDEALSWIVAHQESAADEDFEEASDDEEEMKMVLVVRSDLKMSPGKVAAQCVHAALGAVRICSVESANSLNYWEEGGEATICLKCETEEEMVALEAQAKSLNITTYIVHDAGRTEIAPDSKTVLAIGPAFISDIDKVSRHLKLYR